MGASSSGGSDPTVPNGPTDPEGTTWAYPGRGGRRRREDPEDQDPQDHRDLRDHGDGWDRREPPGPPTDRADWLPTTDAARTQPARSSTGRIDWDRTDPELVPPPREQPGPPPGYQPTQAAAGWHPATELAGRPEPRDPRQSAPRDPSAGVVRYGPGVPETAAASQAATSAERIWKTGPPPAAPRRRPPWRRALGPALTVILLGASAVVLFLRFHHAPFQVSGAAITQRSPVQCGVNVTGRIDTNGSAGTISYQWVFQPDPHAPQPLTQTVPQGQRQVFVTVAVQGSGSGSATQKVTLQVLGPQQASAVTTVVVRC